jgi:hypothetical protein
MARVEKFRWEVTMRDLPDTVLREDENGLDTFTKLDMWKVATVTIVQQLGHNAEFAVTHTVPEGAMAEFWRRRRVSVGPVTAPIPSGGATLWGWTIIGHKWPDSDKRQPEYYFFSADPEEDFMFFDRNFHAV